MLESSTILINQQSYMNRENNTVCVCDVNRMQILIFQNGVQERHLCDTLQQIYDYCVENINQASFLVIGDAYNAKRLSDALRRKYHYVYLYSDELLNRHNPNTINAPQNSIKTILESLNEIKSLLKREQPRSANYSFLGISSSQYEAKDIKDLKTLFTESFNGLTRQLSEIHQWAHNTDYLVDLMYNKEPETTHNGSSIIIEDLRKELNEYKNDFYQKSMMKFGVNTVIDILERLYSEKNELEKTHQNTNNVSEELNRLKRIICTCETLIKKLNLRVEYSKEGDEFDGTKMESYDDYVLTDNINKKGRVAYSIRPAIYWTLPRVNDPKGDDLVIKTEIVAIYK